MYKLNKHTDVYQMFMLNVCTNVYRLNVQFAKTISMRSQFSQLVDLLRCFYTFSNT